MISATTGRSSASARARARRASSRSSSRLRVARRRLAGGRRRRGGRSRAGEADEEQAGDDHGVRGQPERSRSCRACPCSARAASGPRSRSRSAPVPARAAAFPAGRPRAEAGGVPVERRARDLRVPSSARGAGATQQVGVRLRAGGLTRVAVDAAELVEIAEDPEFMEEARPASILGRGGSTQRFGRPAPAPDPRSDSLAAWLGGPADRAARRDRGPAPPRSIAPSP